MPRRKSSEEIVRKKTDDGGDGAGSMPYRPPSYGRGIVKNSDEPEPDETRLDETLLRQFIAEILAMT